MTGHDDRAPDAPTGTAAPPAGGGDTHTQTLDDPFVITASGERRKMGTDGGGLELRRRGESGAFTLEESEGGTRARAYEGATSFTPPVPGPDGSGTPTAADSAGGAATAVRPAQPAAPPPAPSNAAALAAARRLILGGDPEPAPPYAAPRSGSDAAAPPAAAVDRGGSGSADIHRPASPPPSPAALPVSPAHATAAPVAGVQPSSAGGATGADPSSAPASRTAPVSAAPSVTAPASTEADRGGAVSELERSGRTAPLQHGDDAPVDVRSEELDEILTMIPGVLVRWGITAVFVTLVILLGISAVIAYPDVVKGKIVLTTPTPPVRVVAHGPGDMERVFVADRAVVRAGAPLVLFRSDAQYADVQRLSAALTAMEPALLSGGRVGGAEFGPLAVGSVQQAYASFLQAYSDFRVLSDDRYHAEKLASLRGQVADHETLRERLVAQQSVQQQQLALAERARERARVMSAQELMSPADADKAEQDYLQARSGVESGRTALTNNEIQISSARAALLDLEQRRSDDGQHLLSQLRIAHRQLRASIASWEQQYLLRAPVDGTVSFFRDLHENQYVAAAEPLLAVVPGGGELVGRVQLAGAGAGKVEAGQRVIVRLDGYPYREYGVLEGRVQSVSQLGFEQGERSDVTYRATVALPRGMRSSYGRKLEFRQEMRGDVDVITEDVSLLQRLFNQFRSLKKTE